MTFTQTTRRGLIGAILGLGAVSVVQGALDVSAWRAYEGLEDEWIRQKHQLLVQQYPTLSGAAKLDEELRLAELQRRALQFGYLVRTRPNALRGGVAQFAWLPWTEKDSVAYGALDSDYRNRDRYIRSLTEALRQHPDYDRLRASQTKLWKTNEYRDLHRRYSSRLHDLQSFYGGDLGSVATE